MTGTSLVRLGNRLNRSAVTASLAGSMEVPWSIALFEHLDATLADPESLMSGTEMVSYSASSWKGAESHFPALCEEFKKRFEDFRLKWLQRFSTEDIHRNLLQGGWILQDEQGWYLALKGNIKEIRSLYHATIHLMVGDAEKLLVMMVSRASHLQDGLGKIWHKEIALSPISKLLPSLEASLRDQEEAYVARLRGSLSQVTFQRFAGAFRSSRKIRHYLSSVACARHVGELWNPAEAYENAFLAFVEDFCDYARGITLLIGEWYQKKWQLYLRGFSRGQLDLFARSSVKFTTHQT
jgi:hypothetical protein